MLFNSIEYLLFLPVTFLVYWTWCSTAQSRRLCLLAASMVFYGWWDVRFLGLMWLTCLVGYVSALALEHSSGLRRKVVAAVGIALNLGVLGVFKYYDFFAQSFASLAGHFGLSCHPVMLAVVLPVGISFYTFQTVGYVVDVYRGEIKAERDVMLFAVFVSFFPQLVAGPIERARNLLPQFKVLRPFDRALATDGMRQMLWGLMKKMLLADNCAVQVDYVFQNYASLSAADLWLGAIYFAFQIYGDFSGYSDMAIGSAKLFGVKLMRNFDLPYFALSVQDFWRRWHISLMAWLRDYLYVPLGGSRCGNLKHWRNVLLVFLVSGLWHGANWTFVVWGLYHGLLLLSFVALLGRSGLDGSAQPLWHKVLGAAATFVSVLVGWVIFRSESLSDAVSYLAAMFHWQGALSLSCSRMPLLLIVALLLTEGLNRHKEHPLMLPARGLWQYGWARMVIYFLLFMATLWWGGEQQAFIYFQF